MNASVNEQALELQTVRDNDPKAVLSDRNALLEAYEALTHEYVGMLLARYSDDEIANRRAIELPYLFPNAALADFDRVLEFQRAQRATLDLGLAA